LWLLGGHRELAGLTPLRWHAVQRDRRDHIDRAVAIDAERVESSEEAFKRKPNSGRPSAP
jgi:hypothetical protein